MRILMAAVVVASIPTAAWAQDDNSDVRLAKLETILITAEKVQPRDYKPDDRTAALLAEIAREDAPKVAAPKARK